MIESVIAQVLSNDSEIQAALPSYDGSPAVFSAGIPKDAPRPALRIHDELARPFSVRSRTGATLRIQVRIEGSRERYDGTALRGLAWLVYMKLNRSDLAPYLSAAGYDNLGCIAEAPYDGPPGAPFPESVVVVECTVLKQS